MNRYPIGRQDFRGIRQEGLVYVDKTKYIHQLVTGYKYYFLSRPRRFGKSLLISTLDSFFQGDKSLFEGLYIYDKIDFERYPTIRISFSDIGYREIGLDIALSKVLTNIADRHDVYLMSNSISLKFKELIHTLNKKYGKQVVVLVDEYDKPIIDYLDKENRAKAIENRGVMKTFFSILKDADPHLKMVFITGVSKFSQVSIFSDLNNLYDITVHKEYNEICGISQDELKGYFKSELHSFDNEKVKSWYNGYKWYMDGNTVYNPWSILNFFSTGDFRNYWFSTGTPTFLTQLSKQMKIYAFEEVEIDYAELQTFDFEQINLISLLFQTGYLTLKSYKPLFNIAVLSFPNLEVKESYLRHLVDAYLDSGINASKQLLSQLHTALMDKDPNKLKDTINQAFSHIPYDLWQKDNEYFYHAIVHLLFSLLGVYIESEVHNKDGRADAIINMDEGIYCLEFKLDKSAQLAIDQIKSKGYLAKYGIYKKPKYAIGINFSSVTKEVEEILWEEFG